MAKVTTYRAAFSGILGLSVENKKVKSTIEWLERNGYSEKSTCYSIWKSQDKLLKYKYDSRFWTILINEVKIHGFNKYQNNNINISDNLFGMDKRTKEYKKRLEEIKEEEQDKKFVLDFSVTSSLDYLRSLNQFVYFVQGENGGPIKIGYTRNVKKRIHALQTGYPYKLVVLHTIVGASPELEGEIHEEFDTFRLHGEWFEPSHEIFDYIEHVKSNFPDYSFLAQFKDNNTKRA